MSAFGPDSPDSHGAEPDTPPSVPGSAFLDPEDPPASRRRQSKHKARSPLRSLVEWGIVIGGALAVALVIQAFLFQAFYIPSESMEPTLQTGDRVLVNKLSYDLHDVNRGDVVVFERPPNEPPSEVHDLIKRVVGLPGDTVEGVDGVVLVNGEPLDESYLASGTITSPFSAVVVPEDHVFVMGDNRGNSRDSRFFGPIDESLIVGRAFVIVWPLGRVGGL